MKAQQDIARQLAELRAKLDKLEAESKSKNLPPPRWYPTDGDLY